MSYSFKTNSKHFYRGFGSISLTIEPLMIRVCCYLNRDLHRNVLNTKPFSRNICGLRHWNNNFGTPSIRSLFLYVLRFKEQKKT